MTDSREELQIFTEAQTAVSDLSEVLRSLFALLPPATEISVLLEDRITCALYWANDAAQFEMRKAAHPDVEICFFPESIRRLIDKSPRSLAALSSELFTLWLAGQIRYRVLASPQAFYKKGYLKALADARPEVQKEVLRHTSSVLSVATLAYQTAKFSLQELRSKYSKSTDGTSPSEHSATHTDAQRSDSQE